MIRWILIPALMLTVIQPAQAADLPFDEARLIIIQAEGRKKPLDTFARETLKSISGRSSYRLPDRAESMSSMDVLFSMWSRTRDWKEEPIVLVADAAVAGALNLPARQSRFSYAELAGNNRLRQIYAEIGQKKAAGRERTEMENRVQTVLNRMGLLDYVVGGAAMTIVPNPTDENGKWKTVPETRLLHEPGTAQELSASLKGVLKAYRLGIGDAFLSETGRLRARLAALAPAVYSSTGHVAEVHYNRLHPFRWAWILYLTGFFVGFIPTRRNWGMAIFCGGLLVHAYGFGLRCWIGGYAPVTNMYESVVWVSLGIGIFGLGLSWIYRTRFYLFVAAPLAVVGLILADMLPAVLDSGIAPLPPVLRSNFWLVLHVLTITLGYAALALAMGMGHVIMGVYLVRPRWMDERSAWHQFVYQALKIGVLLLAVGIVLGGVWANYSWGRFWGWDPKETWSLIALLLYLFAMHGRIAGWWGNFGLSASAAICFHGVLMAWYGVNFVLGKGLHSYGFGGGGAGWVGWGVGLDLLFIGLCILVRWRRNCLQERGASGIPMGAQA